jgi:hypothetical protein
MLIKSKLIVSAPIAILCLASTVSAQSFNRSDGTGNELPSYYDNAGIAPSQQNEIAAHRSGLYAFSSVHHSAVGTRRDGARAVDRFFWNRSRQQPIRLRSSRLHRLCTGDFC